MLKGPRCGAQSPQPLAQCLAWSGCLRTRSCAAAKHNDWHISHAGRRIARGHHHGRLYLRNSPTGLVITDADNAVTETLRITYTAVVRNIFGNVNAATLTNRANGTYGTSNTLAQVSAANITVVEQNVSQSKASSPTTGDVGDTITYTIVVTNASGRAQAYDVVITDVFPSKFIFNADSFVSTPDSTVISTSVGLTATFAVITPGATARITVTGILSVAVIPSEVITNFTGAAGTSLPGLAATSRSTYDTINSTERISNSSNNTYLTSANSPETINAPAIAKTLVNSATSQLRERDAARQRQRWRGHMADRRCANQHGRNDHVDCAREQRARANARSHRQCSDAWREHRHNRHRFGSGCTGHRFDPAERSRSGCRADGCA